MFTGREDDLHRLSTSFAARQSSQSQHQRRFVLFGLGGSGKTQICLKYVQAHRERYGRYSDRLASYELTVPLGIGAYSGSMRAATTVSSSALRRLHVSYRWMRTLTALSEGWPTSHKPGSLCSIMPTTPNSGWPRISRRETEATLSSPAEIPNVNITIQWDIGKWGNFRSTIQCHY